MTDGNTCTCRGYAAMHKPHPHADRDGSESRCTCSVPSNTAHVCAEVPQTAWIDAGEIKALVARYLDAHPREKAELDGLVADRDGSEARAQLEREHERALAAYVPEDKADEVERLRDEVADLRAAVVEMAPKDEVLVEGSYFARADLPRILGNYMRSAGEAWQDVKALAEQVTDTRRRAEKAEAALARVEAALDIRSRARAWMHDIGYEDHEIDKAEAWRQPVEPWLQGDTPAAVIDLETAAGFAREYEEVIRAALRDPYAEAAS